MLRALPRNIVVFFVIAYRKIVSPTYGPVCKYWPSCSEYCQESIVNSGVFLGVFYSTKRLVRCNPWSRGGVDPPKPGARYQINRFGFASRRRPDA